MYFYTFIYIYTCFCISDILCGRGVWSCRQQDWHVHIEDNLSFFQFFLLSFFLSFFKSYFGEHFVLREPNKPLLFWSYIKCRLALCFVLHPTFLTHLTSSCSLCLSRIESLSPCQTQHISTRRTQQTATPSIHVCGLACSLGLLSPNKQDFLNFQGTLQPPP